MNENLKKFIELVSKDPELVKKLTVNNKDEAAEKIKLAISIAKENGIDLTEKDFRTMNDNDLEAVAGGYEIPDILLIYNQMFKDSSSPNLIPPLSNDSSFIASPMPPY